jgi:hypothetical protein
MASLRYIPVRNIALDLEDNPMGHEELLQTTRVGGNQRGNDNQVGNLVRNPVQTGSSVSTRESNIGTSGGVGMSMNRAGEKGRGDGQSKETEPTFLISNFVRDARFSLERWGPFRAKRMVQVAREVDKHQLLEAFLLGDSPSSSKNSNQQSEPQVSTYKCSTYPCEVARLLLSGTTSQKSIGKQDIGDNHHDPVATSLERLEADYFENRLKKVSHLVPPWLKQRIDAEKGKCANI